MLDSSPLRIGSFLLKDLLKMTFKTLKSNIIISLGLHGEPYLVEREAQHRLDGWSQGKLVTTKTNKFVQVKSLILLCLVYLKQI